MDHRLRRAALWSSLLAVAISVVPAVVHAEDELTYEMTYPLPARTGQPFTIEPVYSGGHVPAADQVCRWEFRWGNTASLRDNLLDETFGSMLFEGLAEDGFCGAWTFTLPWVPVPQFEVLFNGPGASVRSGVWPDRDVFTAEIVGTDRRIRSSNLPVAQVLPNDYTPEVGKPVTYTRYLVGGAPVGGIATWSARLGTGEDPIRWESWTTSSTFTVTPPTTGDLYVRWYRTTDEFLLAASYDPPVRRTDTTRPDTTTPIPRLGSGTSAGTAPVGIFWSGKDTGWGIKSFRLERSVDGGAWAAVALPTATTKSITQVLTFGRAYRYRVRATDKAGNIGSWDYGPTFTPKSAADTNPAVAYTSGWKVVADPTAYGGVIHESRTGERAVSFSFTGRSIAWLAERGPTFGKARVYIDGVLVGTYDTGQAVVAARQIVFRHSWPSVGSHRIRVVVSGTTGRPTVSVDGFLILR